MGLAAQIRNFKQTVITRQDEFVKELIGQISLSLILKSPVGDPTLWKNPKAAPPGYQGGNFRANWNLGIGAIDRSTREDLDHDGGATLDRIVGSIPDNASGKNYFITNSLPYAIPLENGHSSKQAPYGMVTLTVIEMSDFISKAAVTARAINGRSIEF